MALSDQQVETFIYQFRDQITALQADLRAQNSILNQIANSVASLTASSGSSGTSVIGNADTYVVGNGILHKLATTFQSIVTFLAAPVFKSLTASRPLKLDSGNNVISALISLASLSDITGTLGIGNGGTNGTTAAAARGNLSAAALPQTIAGSNFDTPTLTTVCGGSQSVTVTGSSFTAPSGGGPCTGNFTFTINGTNFTVSIAPAACTGSQALV